MATAVGKKIGLLGCRFGRLVVIAEAPRVPSYRRWHCYCDCGNTTVVYNHHLTNGSTCSCGCLRRERSVAGGKTAGKMAYRHGAEGTPTHNSWMAMRNRCNNPNNNRYHRYGARGVTVCNRWNDSKSGYLAFLEDMGERPVGMTLDRIDNDGNYEPSNCRWVTPWEQMRHVRGVKRHGG